MFRPTRRDAVVWSVWPARRVAAARNTTSGRLLDEARNQFQKLHLSRWPPSVIAASKSAGARSQREKERVHRNLVQWYDKFMPTYYSQADQDRVLNETVFCGMRNGVFVDVGAHDGIPFSNTLMFERELGWTGLCIEPNPDIFPRLIEDRSAICLEIAIAGRNGRLPFIKAGGYAQMLSGLSESMDPRHRERIERETKKHNTSYSVLEVSVRPLAHVLSQHRIPEIHYLSVDTEGNEADALGSIDFDAVMVHVITAEANYHEARDQIDAKLFRRFDLVGQHN
jgi:FkbM family methyltransferase